jgi:hypothetical protein
MSQTEASNESARRFHAARLIDPLMARTAIALAMNTDYRQRPGNKALRLGGSVRRAAHDLDAYDETLRPAVKRFCAAVATSANRRPLTDGRRA